MLYVKLRHCSPSRFSQAMHTCSPEQDFPVTLLLTERCFFALSSSDYCFLFPNHFPYLPTAMEAKHIASLFQVPDWHLTAHSSAGTFPIARGKTRQLDWNPSRALLPVYGGEQEPPLLIVLGAGTGLLPDCTALCRFKETVTELSLNWQHIRNLQVLPTSP